MKASDGDLYSSLAQRSCDVQSARELIRLNAYEHHHASASLFNQRRDAARAYARVRFIEGVYFQFDITAQRLSFGALKRKPVEYDAPTEPVAEEEWGVLR